MMLSELSATVSNATLAFTGAVEATNVGVLSLNDTDAITGEGLVVNDDPQNPTIRKLEAGEFVSITDTGDRLIISSSGGNAGVISLNDTDAITGEGLVVNDDPQNPTIRKLEAGEFVSITDTGDRLIISSSGGNAGVLMFTGTGEYIVPDNVESITISAYSGGGGGAGGARGNSEIDGFSGGGGGGGGSSAVLTKTFPVKVNDVIAYACGEGGAGGAGGTGITGTGNNGVAGGDTTCRINGILVLTAIGGPGGIAPSSTVSGGNGGGNNISFYGGGGGGSGNNAGGFPTRPGSGGVGTLVDGEAGVTTTGGRGATGTAAGGTGGAVYGSGGGGSGGGVNGGVGGMSQPGLQTNGGNGGQGSGGGGGGGGTDDPGFDGGSGGFGYITMLLKPVIN